MSKPTHISNNMRRRDFLRQSGFATAGTMLIPNFLKAFEQFAQGQSLGNGKVLVVIQLSGGNDGLNTVVPFRNDVYYQSRPRLAVPNNTVIRLSDELGLNPALRPLQALYDQGWLNIINGVGYPNPDRSHFRSMDIWQSASNSNEYLSTGWIGRYLDNQCQDTSCNIAYEAIEVDDTLSLVMKGEKIKGLAMRNAAQLAQQTKSPYLRALAIHPQDDHDHDNVQYLYKTLAETVSSADYIQHKLQRNRRVANYPMQPFAQQLKAIADLITAGMETHIYYASLSGFDTHVNQKNQQERLLKIYAEAVAAFAQDLQQQQRWQDTIVMTFSEFGRRVTQNASGGTDHGTANSLFLMGGKLKKAGVYNPLPSLTDLDAGDLKYTLDFRRIYAMLLEKHLQAPAKTILQGDFEPLALL